MYIVFEEKKNCLYICPVYKINDFYFISAYIIFKAFTVSYVVKSIPMGRQRTIEFGTS